jgi:hypothetical protein
MTPRTWSNSVTCASISQQSLMHLHQRCESSLWPGLSHNGGSTKLDLYPSHHEVDVSTCWSQSISSPSGSKRCL